MIKFFRKLPTGKAGIRQNLLNEAIRKEINTYSRYLIDLDVTYSEYAELLENRVRVFLADKKVHRLSNWFENNDSSIKGGTSFDFVESRVNLSFQNTGVPKNAFGSIHKNQKHRSQY